MLGRVADAAEPHDAERILVAAVVMRVQPVAGIRGVPAGLATRGAVELARADSLFHCKVCVRLSFGVTITPAGQEPSGTALLCVPAPLGSDLLTMSLAVPLTRSRANVAGPVRCLGVYRRP